MQIIDIISKYLIKKLENTSFRSKFVAIFLEDIPVHVENGVVSKKADLKSLQERLTLILSNNVCQVFKTK